jgi:oxygen-independent coproporphyrinogen-3 oxidase
MSTESGPPWLIPQAAYVHVPFCAHHCGYCDFAVVAGRDHLQDLYIEALSAELSTLETPKPVRTAFLGGGTPTFLDCTRLERLLRIVREWFPLKVDYEFSIESNPNSITPEKIRVLSDYGVNRISFGAQSFQPRLLQVLERDHQPDDVAGAFECARKRIPRVSLDLIFGVPGQTLAEWDDDLKRTLELAPDHVSTYGLTYEKGTRLWKQRAQGEIHALHEERELDMYSHALDVLADAGFEHYEISNHALAGCRCRHNETYWANEAHYGFGLGAARCAFGRRETNVRSIDEYLRRAFAGEPMVQHGEELDPEARARETIAIQLRRTEGVNRSRFREQTGYEVDSLAGSALTRYRQMGLLEDNGAGVRLTRQGMYVADAVIVGLM